MTFETEFPDYPAGTMPSIPAGFEDISWHNDVCPSFEHKAHGLRLFVDYPDDSMRELPGGERFTLYPINEAGEQGEVLIETSAWDEMNSALLDYIS